MKRYAVEVFYAEERTSQIDLRTDSLTAAREHAADVNRRTHETGNYAFIEDRETGKTIAGPLFRNPLSFSNPWA